MFSVFAKSVCRDVFLVGKPWPNIPLFLNYHAKGIPTIMVGTFIVLEEPSNIIEVMTRTFIALDGPPEHSDGITVTIEGCTLAEVVPQISYPMGIPPNPPDGVSSSKAPACGDHFLRLPVGANACMGGSRVQILDHRLCEFHVPTLSGRVVNSGVHHVVSPAEGSSP